MPSSPIPSLGGQPPLALYPWKRPDTAPSIGPDLPRHEYPFTLSASMASPIQYRAFPHPLFSGRNAPAVSNFLAFVNRDRKDDPITALEPFQINAIQALNHNKDVIISAPTGAGKTIPAEYLIYRNLSRKEPNQVKTIIYTVPIKALGNDKLYELREIFDQLPHRSPNTTSNVGLINGDRVDNPDAPVVVMTTEVLRNMVVNDAPQLADVEAVVLDECHFIGDPSRGSVWEEVLLQLPPAIQQLHLSATIGNPEAYSAWVDAITPDRDLHLETITQRKIPLTPLFLDPDQQEVIPIFGRGTVPEPGTMDPAEIEALLSEQYVATHYEIENIINGQHGSDPYFFEDYRFNPKYTLNLLANSPAPDGGSLFPAIIFLFNRMDCNGAVQQCLNSSSSINLLTPEELNQVNAEIDKFLAYSPANRYNHPRYQLYFDGLRHGISVHHSGSEPQLNHLTERLMKQGLLKAVFATETLAYGVNMPAKTVVLGSYIRTVPAPNGSNGSNGSHGSSVSHVPGKQRIVDIPLERWRFQQLVGRAGRRGKTADNTGYVVMVPPPFTQRNLTRKQRQALNPVDYMTQPAEDLKSRLEPKPLLVLSLLNRHSYLKPQQAEQQILDLLGNSFKVFLNGQDRSNLEREFKTTLLELKQNGYVNDDNSLTLKGNIARQISHQHHLDLTELLVNGNLKDLSAPELAATVALFNLRNEPTFVDVSQDTMMESSQIQQAWHNVDDSIPLTSPLEPDAISAQTDDDYAHHTGFRADPYMDSPFNLRRRYRLARTTEAMGKLYYSGFFSPQLKDTVTRDNVFEWCIQSDPKHLENILTVSVHPGDLFRTLRETASLLGQIDSGSLFLLETIPPPSQPGNGSVPWTHGEVLHLQGELKKAKELILRGPLEEEKI